MMHFISLTIRAAASCSSEQQTLLNKPLKAFLNNLGSGLCLALVSDRFAEWQRGIVQKPVILLKLSQRSNSFNSRDVSRLLSHGWMDLSHGLRVEWAGHVRSCQVSDTPFLGRRCWPEN